MLSLSPPGSFRLCANPAFEGEAARELGRLVSAVRNVSHAFPVLGLLLTGSFARGEGVIIHDPQGGLRWLSDVECLVVLPNDQRWDWARLKQVLGKAARDANKDRKGLSGEIKVELSPILASRLAAMRPAIFTCELLEHAKLLWGWPAELRMPSKFKATRDLLCRDALRLLNNRIMEQVAVRLSLENESELASQPDVAYALSKFWVELGTSLSVFLDCYLTSYQARQATLENALTSSRTGLDSETVKLLMWKLAEGMALKRGCVSANQYTTEASFECAADVAARIWWWETGNLLGEGMHDDGWRNVPVRLRRIDTAAARIRDWGRLVLRTGAVEYLHVAVLGDVLRAGSFGNAVYAAGCLLCFFWEQIGSGSGPGQRISYVLGRLFGVEGANGPLTRRLLALRALSAWRTHLKSAAA